MLTQSEAGVISTCTQGILYGVSVLMFILTIWVLLRNRRRRRLNHGMILSACALFVLSTAEMFNDIARLYRAFITVGPQFPGGPESFFNDIVQPTFLVKSVLYNTQTLILDGVVIYRAYIVWQSIPVIVIPVLGWLGLLTVSIVNNVFLATAPPQAPIGEVFGSRTGRWITATYTMSFVTNLVSSTLLAYRIWTVSRESAPYRSHNVLLPVLRVIIESGAIYSATVLVALVSFLLKTNVVYVLLDSLSPVICIVFYMIIVRVGLASDRKIIGASTQRDTLPTGFSDRHPSRGRPKHFAMDTITVEISQIIESDRPSMSAGAQDSMLHITASDDESEHKRRISAP